MTKFYICREFEAEVQDRASAALSNSTQHSGYTQKQLPENATLPQTTTGVPIGQVARNTSSQSSRGPQISRGLQSKRGLQNNKGPQSSTISQRLLQVSTDLDGDGDREVINIPSSKHDAAHSRCWVTAACHCFRTC